MVLVTDDWSKFKEAANMYIERSRVFYRMVEEGNYVYVQIMAGKIGFEREYDRSKESGELEDVLRWLEMQGAIRVVRAVPEDLFFYTQA